MSHLEVLVVPDARLRQACAPVTLFDAALRQLADDMLETMYKSEGVGLAAPQVGRFDRLIVLDIAREGETPQPLCMVNPEIVTSSAELSTYHEGCLSLPGQYADVVRPAKNVIKYQTTSGDMRELEADGLLSTCILHEMDHLNGVLFVDHLSRIKRDMLLRRLAKEQKFARG